jgi:GAF domain-containing protein/sugar diacid utilization regulator
MTRSLAVEDARAPSREEARASGYEAVFRAFADVAVALGDFTERDELLHLIAERVCQLIGAQRCSVYLRDGGSGLFRGQVGHPAVADDKVKRLVAGVPADGFTREIVETKRPVVVSDALTDPRPVRSAMRAWRVRSMLGVPMVVRGEVIGLLFLDHDDRPRVFTPAEQEIASAFADLAAIAISQAELTAELRSSAAMVARRNELLRKATAMDDLFVSLAVRGSTIEEVVEAVADLTDKPAAVYDRRLVRVTGAMPTRERERPVPQLLEPDMLAHAPLREALARVDDVRPAVIGPMRGARLTRRLLVAAIVTRGRRLGYLVVGEHGSRLRSLDRHVARRAAALVAIEYSVERRGGASEAEERAALAGDLLAGGSDAGSLERRARLLGVDLGRPRVVVAIASRRVGAPPPSARTAAAAVCGGRSDPDVLAVEEDRATVLLLPADEATPVAAAAVRECVQAAFEVMAAEAWLAIGVSRPRTEVGALPAANAEAREVLRCITAFADGPGVVSMTACELGPGRPLLAACDRETLDRFARETLGPLLDDDPGMRDLLSTLDVFFRLSRSVRESAATLGVHENTIRYRLARAQALTGLALGSSADDQVTAQLALSVLRLQRRLPCPPVPSAARSEAAACAPSA